MKKNIFGLIALLMPLFAFAEEAHEAEEAGIPSEVWFQVFNFIIFVFLIAYFLRSKIKDFFSQRVAVFKQALVKADHAKKQAEENHKQIKESLEKLETTTENTLRDARAEAEIMKQKILAEAKELAENVRTDAERTAHHEIERAKAELRNEMLAQALNMAKQTLNDTMKENDQKRLQDEFVEKIQAVR